MRIKLLDVWIADLKPHIGTETGKARSVLVVQTNLLNDFHPSTIICSITTNVMPEAEFLEYILKEVRQTLLKTAI